ncbi:hypothetical protein T492DRAFT_881683, partial [Pavlovales sp. CCMP2436]
VERTRDSTGRWRWRARADSESSKLPSESESEPASEWRREPRTEAGGEGPGGEAARESASSPGGRSGDCTRMPPRPMAARAEAVPDCEPSQRELASPRPPPPPGAGDWRAWMGPLVLSGSGLGSRRLVGVLGDGDAISACTSVRPTGLGSGLGPCSP